MFVGDRKHIIHTKCHLVKQGTVTPGRSLSRVQTSEVRTYSDAGFDLDAGHEAVDDHHDVLKRWMTAPVKPIHESIESDRPSGNETTRKPTFPLTAVYGSLRPPLR